DDAYHGPRKGLALFALVALVVLPAAGWFAVVSSLLVTLAYLVYAHPAGWDLYYLEIMPLLPFLTACGIWAVWLSLGTWRHAANDPSAHGARRPIAVRLSGASGSSRHPANAHRANRATRIPIAVRRRRGAAAGTQDDRVHQISAAAQLQSQSDRESGGPAERSSMVGL